MPNRPHHLSSPPSDRIPPAIRDALAAVERRKRGGPPLTLEQTMALVELSAWDFNGVEPGHPDYEIRLAAWQAEVEARHPRAPDPEASGPRATIGALPPDAAPQQQQVKVQPPGVATVARTVLVVVGVVVGLYVVYLLRQPIGWVVLAAFLAVAMSGPVRWLAQRMKRGLAIALAYVLLLLAPVLLALIVIPPFVSGAQDLAQQAPTYAQQARDFADKNPTLRKLEQNYGVLTQLQNEAKKLPKKVGTGAAGTLSDIGLGLINSIFAGLTILILSIFLVAYGGRWVTRWLASHPPDRARRLERTLDRIAAAVGNYVAGALVQATVAGVTTFIVLEILGVPFAAPLAVIVALFDLVPLVGATIGAVLVGVVTLFSDFPTDTIVWVVWAIIYQQLENNVIQPQIQTRAVNLNPFAVLVAVLFGSELFGVFGALLAIPVAASIQIALKEWWQWRHDNRASLAGIVEPGAT